MNITLSFIRNIINYIDYISGRPEPSVTWFNGSQPVQTTGGIPMGRHVIVNRLEVQHVTRDAFNTTYKCQASNTKLVPPAERTVRLDMLCKYNMDKYFSSMKVMIIPIIVITAKEIKIIMCTGHCAYVNIDDKQ